MNIFWQGTDITGYVQIRKAVARDTCGGRCDGIEIEFENAESWYKWGPAEDDEIRVAQDGWESGAMYLHTIAPMDGKYRVIATSLPCSARQKQWASFEQKTIEEILRRCAAQTNMEFRVYGIDNTRVIPYIQQENEGCAAFLDRLATLEGARLKCVNGRYTLIGLEWAQERSPVAALNLIADQNGVDYRRTGTKERELVITTPYATGRATDENVEGNRQTTITTLPAMNDIQAARWARNLLREKNRKCERLRISGDFNPMWSAMLRIDIQGGTDANGEWLIEEAEHDLKERKSTVMLYRKTDSVR